MPTIIIPPKPSVPPIPDRLAVSAKEAAAMLSVNERTLRNWTNQGKVQASRIGGRVLYPLDHLRRLINGTGNNSSAVQDLSSLKR